ASIVDQRLENNLTETITGPHRRDPADAFTRSRHCLADRRLDRNPKRFVRLALCPRLLVGGLGVLLLLAGEHPHQRLVTNTAAIDEPGRGNTRLVEAGERRLDQSLGIVCSEPGSLDWSQVYRARTP